MSLAARLERSEAAAVVVADLRELEFLDSTGVRVLITSDMRAREQACGSGSCGGMGWSHACSR